jgi:hypothetical protein
VSYGFVLTPSLTIGFEDSLSSKCTVVTVVTIPEVQRLVREDPNTLQSYLSYVLAEKKGLIVKMIHGDDGSISHVLTYFQLDELDKEIGAIATAKFSDIYANDFPSKEGKIIYETSIRAGFEVVEQCGAKLVVLRTCEDYNTIKKQFIEAIDNLVKPPSPKEPETEPKTVLVPLLIPVSEPKSRSYFDANSLALFVAGFAAHLVLTSAEAYAREKKWI